MAAEQEIPTQILPQYTTVFDHEMNEAIGQALGRASVAWDPMDCTGVFDSNVCAQLTQELKGIVNQFAASYGLTHNDATMEKLYAALRGVGLSDREILDSVMAMQNAGILFREYR